MAPSVAGNRNLTTLGIGCNRSTCQGVINGLEAFNNHSTLKSLEVSVKCSHLSDTLVGCISKLQSLNLNIENLLVEGSVIKETEPYYCSYKTAELTVRNGEALLKALRSNYYLSNCPFDIMDEGLSSEGDKKKVKHICSDIQSILKLNGAGRRYMLVNRLSKKHAVGVLTAVADNLDCLFYHLRENPGIFV